MDSTKYSDDTSPGGRFAPFIGAIPVFLVRKSRCHWFELPYPRCCLELALAQDVVPSEATVVADVVDVHLLLPVGRRLQDAGFLDTLTVQAVVRNRTTAMDAQLAGVLAAVTGQ